MKKGQDMAYDKVFILADETTEKCCWPVVSELESLQNALHIVIPSTDAHKNLESLSYVWTQLSNNGATRHSLLINLGGGMVTDLGGLAASTFKRGIDFVNIPTTLLAMVDASEGGKTGINFNGLKNEIGVFNEPKKVILDTTFLKTLDKENILSGYAEMLKHGLLSNSETLDELLAFDLDNIDYAHLGTMVRKSVAVKKRVVKSDPHEHGLRKSLNLGHTIGHAIESFALKQGTPVLHGYAVAWGLVCELYLSSAYFSFPTETMHEVVRFINTHYGKFSLSCDDYDDLFALMKHDKKNVGDKIQFALLSGTGKVRINRTMSKEQIFEALDFYREGQ
jgi:3-dehydroquinate synthase